uniref:Transmembrane protein n=1 Tax=Pediastrum duplex TaxID=3105 RepID=A0A1W5RMP0_PEDDU|nr:hypothetical protein [Pediastrum duplex]AQU64447.1 hypothetical protein [Pediastrum duplex]
MHKQKDIYAKHKLKNVSNPCSGHNLRSQINESRRVTLTMYKRKKTHFFVFAFSIFCIFSFFTLALLKRKTRLCFSCALTQLLCSRFSGANAEGSPLFHFGSSSASRRERSGAEERRSEKPRQRTKAKKNTCVTKAPKQSEKRK